MLTCEDIAKLTAYLPILESWNQPFATWTINPGIFPYPEYVTWVESLFHDAGQPVWCDYKYQPQSAGKLVTEDTYITHASLNQIKTLLTYCVRGERFCDGHWEAMLTQGRILQILRRLREIEAEKCLISPKDNQA